MEEIKVGEYVRIVQARRSMISKVYEIEQAKCNLIDKKYFCMIEGIEEWFTKNDIVNHSSNLIDIIEVGDIIQLKGAEKSKYEVLKISWSKSKGKHIHIINPFRTEGGKDIFVEDIDSILTKEQFEKKKYIVGDE